MDGSSIEKLAKKMTYDDLLAFYRENVEGKK